MRPSSSVGLTPSAVPVVLADLGRRHTASGFLHEHQPIYTHEHTWSPQVVAGSLCKLTSEDLSAQCDIPSRPAYQEYHFSISECYPEPISGHLAVMRIDTNG